MTALPQMRQNPTREGLGAPCSGPLLISEDDPGDHVGEQITINPLERRITGQKNPARYTRAQLTGASKRAPAGDTNGVWGEYRPGMEGSNYCSTASSQSPQKKPPMSSQTTGDQGFLWSRLSSALSEALPTSSDGHWRVSRL